MADEDVPKEISSLAAFYRKIKKECTWDHDCDQIDCDILIFLNQIAHAFMYILLYVLIKVTVD